MRDKKPESVKIMIFLWTLVEEVGETRSFTETKIFSEKVQLMSFVIKDQSAVYLID